MGNGAISQSRDSRQLTRQDYENLEKMCRNSHFRDHFDEYKITFNKAIDNDAIDMIELLIPAGNSKRLQPLHIACRLAKLESAELLLSAGFSCVLLDEKGRTPLHLCCTSRSLDAGLCATLLVLAGKKALSMRDSEGLTPLHLAAAQNNLHVIQALMNNGADVTISTAAGHSPYQVAIDNRNYEALNLLKELVSNKSKALSRKHNLNQQYLAPVTQPKEQTQADVDRIMQVWERFFENAFKRMGIDPQDLEESPSAKSVDSRGNYEPQYDNWTSEDYYGDLRRYSAPTTISAKKSSMKSNKASHGSKSARLEAKGWDDFAYPEHSSKSLLASSKTSHYTDTFGENSNDSTYDYNYANSYYSGEAPYSAADNEHYWSHLDPSIDAQRVVDWFEWIVFYEESADPDGEGLYYVLSKSTGQTLWLDDHVQSFVHGTLLPCDDWHDYELHMSYPLPTTLLEAITRGWLTYYESAENACRWINLPTKSIETLLPVGVGEQAQVLCDLGMTPCDSDSRYYSADQTCALAWVLVVGVSCEENLGGADGVPDTVYYYRNRISGETSWHAPGNWDDLVSSWENWTLCCNEDTCDDMYWYDFESGESVWVET